ncbi:lyase family protein [Streptomyces castrisilvae]|uniref:Lyase family protein n=1 Tax=Streptomyces castrisilvae TaxID=3033811 RepID=A0ABY9HL98_9ACTN|nr:lyase family protein [Streptomyces sp. Mut1]WLQ35199.1 lyase family protein [Streptomyces sp. Mut1]
MTGAQAARPPEIILCSLGGTVQCTAAPDGAAVPDRDAGLLLVAPGTVPEGVRVCELPLAAVPSAALDLPDIVGALRAVERLVDAGAAGAVLTMGTDMLEEAAFAADLLWRRAEPLVVTAAMRAPEKPGADGPANLRAALLVAAHPAARHTGCLVVLNDEVHAAWQVRKTHSSSPAAFRSAHSGPLGTVTEGRVRITARPMDRPRLSLPEDARFPRVALLRAALGDDGALLDALDGAVAAGSPPGTAAGPLGRGFAGAVIEAAGGGSVPPAWCEGLARATRRMPVVYASRTGDGPTFQTTYGGSGSERDLIAMGLRSAGLLDGLKTRVLLRLLLAAGAGRQRIAEAFRAFDEPTHRTAVPRTGPAQPRTRPEAIRRETAMTGPTRTPAADPARPRLYGAQTELALANFPGSGRRLRDVPELVRAYGWTKAAAARANMDLGVLDAERGTAIVEAAREVADGRHDEDLPTALVQGGGGTSTNMNLNEVLAARATQLLRERGSELTVHPNDHVNRSQSTNDTYPTAMALALRELAEPTLRALDRLDQSLRSKAETYDRLERLGRTCLQDAVPLTVGQTHRAQAVAVRRSAEGLRRTADALAAVPLGATAVGSGAGAPDGFTDAAVRHLARFCGMSVTASEDFFDSMAHLDPYSALAAACARAATLLAKIAADLRLLSSGPAGGLGEVGLPVRQAGSSIMPGKVNPVIPELVMQLSYRIRGAAATVDLGVAAGELELNIMEPVILDALVTALRDLRDAADSFAEKCVDGLVWHEAALERNLRGSLLSAVEAAAAHGYERAGCGATEG